MDDLLTDEQRMLGDGVERFGAEHWDPTVRAERLAEEPAAFRRRWAAMAELGWTMLPVPAEEGGLGGSAEDVAVVAEGFGRHLIADPWITSCVLVPALLRGEAEVSELVGGIAEGRWIAAAGLLERDGGYDPGHVATRATRRGGGWRLDGAKLHVEDGGDADWFVVSARTAGGDDEREGVGLFLVPREATGLAVRRFRAVDGHRHAGLVLDGVTDATPVGASDGAAPRIEEAIDRAIAAHLAEAVGSMEAATAATLAYLHTRHQFGVAIGSFQVLQHRAVDMAVDGEEARAVTMQATAALAAPPRERVRAVSAAKVRIGDCGLRVGQEAIQLHGGVGFSDELIVSHHYKRLLMIDQAHGPRSHHRARFSAA